VNTILNKFKPGPLFKHCNYKTHFNTIIPFIPMCPDWFLLIENLQPKLFIHLSFHPACYVSFIDLKTVTLPRSLRPPLFGIFRTEGSMVRILLAVRLLITVERDLVISRSLAPGPQPVACKICFQFKERVK
jgi:hypothetical protein